MPWGLKSYLYYVFFVQKFYLNKTKGSELLVWKYC